MATTSVSVNLKKLICPLSIQKLLVLSIFRTFTFLCFIKIKVFSISPISGSENKIAMLSQSLWTTTPKNFYQPNKLSIRCGVYSFNSWSTVPLGVVVQIYTGLTSQIKEKEEDEMPCLKVVYSLLDVLISENVPHFWTIILPTHYIV